MHCNGALWQRLNNHSGVHINVIYRVLQDTHEELLVTTHGNMKKVNATFHDLIEEHLKTQQQGLVFRLCRSMMRAT
jgi:hypothetical protein